MSQPSHIFLDFDETLFNHYAFLDWVDDFLVQHHQIEPTSFKAQIDDFHTPMGEKLRLYRHEEHIEQVTNRRWSFLSAEMEKALKARKDDFCYPDAHRLLRKLVKTPADIRVLTYGDGAYQRFKLNTCHLLHELRLPVHVVDEPKRIFLEREFPAANGILVDDKHPLNLPNGWTHIWINRAGKTTAQVLEPQEQMISTLDDVSKLIATYN